MNSYCDMDLLVLGKLVLFSRVGRFCFPRRRGMKIREDLRGRESSSISCTRYFLARVVYVRYLAPGSSTRHKRVVSLNAPVAQGALMYVYYFLLHVRQFDSR